MRRMDLFCASQAATAIRLGMGEEGSSSSSSSSSYIPLSSSPAIDRCNPIIRDSRRLANPLPPCSSQPPISPKPHNHHLHKSKKSSSKPNDETKKKSSKKPNDQKGKSCAEPSESIARKSWGCTKPGEFISHPTSSRYLLGDTAFLDVLSDFDPILKLVPAEPSKPQVVKTVESSASKPPSSSRSPDQVVVLRVSLHCRGCERKMRKHISRMEGVTSFNIDFAAKKLTVVGDVTPLSVLSSVSKVKNAQLWPPAISSAVPPVSSS
ncbi:unnamed protein product [Ilex paraguariensis]|uniref:HMA domain-containing protein n=1 Tax=Ilex paraguariensis TaxID=185542 RepID=A0ABC8RB28_9AQUA